MKILLVLIFISLSLQFSIDPEKIHFTDEHGRSLIFHGVNVVYKIFPFKPRTDTFDKYSFSDQDIANLKAHGINAVRLGLIWEGLETEEGVYNTELINVYKGIAVKLKANDIGIIIDLHQDLISRLFCGEGMPLFYARLLKINSSCLNSVFQAIMQSQGICHSFYGLDIEFDKENVPTRESCDRQSFAKLHTIAEFDTLYAQIYDNEHGLFDKLVNLWKFIIKNVNSWDIHSHLIGYDLWNEPFPRRILSDFKTLKPGYKDDRDYVEFYGKLFERLSTETSHFISLFQNSPFDALNGVVGFYFGNFSKLPAGPEKNTQQGLNVHYYCYAADASMLSQKEPTLEQAKGICRDFYTQRIAFDAKRAAELKVPLLITEFGACSHGQSCQEEMKSIINESEKYLANWFYWNYKGFDDPTTTMGGDEEGLIDENTIISEVKRKAIVRPYAMKYQGKPILSFYDEIENIYTTKFMADTAIDAPTELYVSKTLTTMKDYDVIVRHDDKFEAIQVFEGDFVKIQVKGSGKTEVEVIIIGKY